MSNLSFARIMYGTNEDVRSFARMSSAGLSSPSTDAAGSSSASEKHEGASLQELLHKAWQALLSKD